MRKALLIIGICLISLECGYHLRGTGSSLPQHIKTLYVPMFKNRTTRFELDRKLTESVIDEMVARGKVEIIGEEKGADALLIGEILSFQVSPIAFGREGTADRYSITITAKILMRDLKNNKIIFSNPYFPYNEDYEVPEGSDFESVETEAIDQVAEKFARSLIASILEGF